jgi:hypothetical protein
MTYCLPILAIQTEHLLLAGGAMSGMAGLVILFIFIYLKRDANMVRKHKKLSILFSDLIAEVIQCAHEKELEEVMGQPSVKGLVSKYAHRRMARSILTKELIYMHKNMSGVAADNVRWLFTYLRLEEDVVQRFRSKKWHIKAKAIQQLAEMQQLQHLARIYRDVNNNNEHVRMEAQVALVKLTGFSGLRFLNVARHPISDWQQLCLLQELPVHGEVQPDKIRSWLFSDQESIVAFSLKLIHKYHCYELYDEVITCLDSTSACIRQQAAQALECIADDYELYYSTKALKQEAVV